MEDASFEALLSKAGDFGKWQITILFFGALSGLFLKFHHLGYVFHSAIPGHWCASEELLSSNWTSDQKRQISVPRDENGQWSQCQIKDRDYSSISNLTFQEALLHERKENQSTYCSTWEFDQSEFVSTTVSEWDLVCSNAALRPTIQGVYMIGVLCSSLVFSPMADQIGKRRTLVPALLLSVSSTLASSFMPSYYGFLILRFLTGMGAMGVYCCVVVVVLECVGVHRRGATMMFFDVGPPVGTLLWTLLAYYVREWRQLYLTVGLAGTIFISYYWLITESPRWLVLRGRYPEAICILQKIARWNKKQLPSNEELTAAMELIRKKDIQCVVQLSILERLKKPLVFWRTPEMRRRSFCVFWCFFVVSVAGFGVTFLAVMLPLSIHLVMLVDGLQSSIVRVAIIPVLERYGRRRVFSTSFFFLALFLLVFLIIPEDGHAWASWIVLEFSVTCISINFTVEYLMAAELFPTSLRNTAIGIASVHSRFGAIIAPFIVDFLAPIHRAIPAAIFSAAAIIAGAVTLLMPEMTGQRLPETAADVEDYKRKKSTNSVLVQLQDLGTC